jgi:hypothetical protein
VTVAETTEAERLERTRVAGRTDAQYQAVEETSSEAIALVPAAAGKAETTGATAIEEDSRAAKVLAIRAAMITAQTSNRLPLSLTAPVTSERVT